MIETATPELTADCSDSGSFESAARDLYQKAALFVGDEAEAMELAEQTVTAVDIDPCADRAAAMTTAMRDLTTRALGRLAARWPARMHPSQAADLGGCVDTDDPESAGISQAQFADLLNGDGRARMRQWLDGLGPVERSVFVLRAVLGRGSIDAAQLLAQATGDSWTAAHVGGAYRSALCSLASSVLDSTTR